MRLRARTFVYSIAVPLTALLLTLSGMSCGRREAASDSKPSAAPTTVGVVKVTRHSIGRTLTVSSELVPFQEIDIYAKESGYVSKLLVDYGSHVVKGQLLAVLEIPELQAQIDQDQASIKSVADMVTNAQNQLSRIQAQHKVVHLEFERLNSVSQSKPGLVAQQEVDDLQGRDLSAEAQVEGAKSNLESARSNLIGSQAKLTRDEAIYSYSHITAPFSGVITQRYANFGTLVQAGTSSSTQAMPLVKLSEEDRYRLVVPVPENYIAYIALGDPVSVRVPTQGRTFPGRVARFASDVHDSTRTMHTEVDVPNPNGLLIPGVYAETTLTLNKSPDALTVPLSAVDRESDHAHALIVNAKNQVESRQIELGIETANEVEIKFGLAEGDEVIVSDRGTLRPGETVHPQITPAATYGSQS